MDIARKIGLSVESYRQLLNGEVPESVARRFGSTTEALQEFVDGGTSIRLAQHYGCGEDEFRDLRRAIGREGAVGLLIGLCLSMRQ
jgi:hypothetical protein